MLEDDVKRIIREWGMPLAVVGSLASARPAIAQSLTDLRPKETNWLKALIHDYGILDGKVDLEDFFAFATAFGFKRGQPGYERRFDTYPVTSDSTRGDGDINLEDFFAFAIDFNKVQKVLPLEISHLLYPAGTIRVKYAKEPDVSYLATGADGAAAAKPVALADGVGGFDVDASEFKGKNVRLKVKGEKDKEAVYGGLVETRVPWRFYDGGLPSDLTIRFNVDSTDKVIAYVVSKVGTGYQYIPNEIRVGGVGVGGSGDYSNGQLMIYKHSIKDIVKGTNTLRFRNINGTITNVVISDSENLKPAF